MKYQNDNDENIVANDLNSIRKNRILKIKKRPFAKNTWYNLLIKNIPEAKKSRR